MPVAAAPDDSPCPPQAPSARDVLSRKVVAWLSPRADEYRHFSPRQQCEVIMRILTEHFGSFNEALQFARSFAGCVLRFPEFTVMESIVLHRVVGERAAEGRLNREERQWLADHFGKSAKDIQRMSRPIAPEERYELHALPNSESK